MKERHKQMLEAIKLFKMKNGISPLVRQIGEMVGLRSTSSVHTHLIAMEKEGLIVKDEFCPRTIKIPGFDYDPSTDSNVLGENDNKNMGFETLLPDFETVYVLHGHWSTPIGDGVEVWGVSKDLSMLQESMHKTGEQMQEEARKDGCLMILSDISQSRYEAENSDGYYIRIYITEHKVEGGTKQNGL